MSFMILRTLGHSEEFSLADLVNLVKSTDRDWDLDTLSQWDENGVMRSLYVYYGSKKKFFKIKPIKLF